MRGQGKEKKGKEHKTQYLVKLCHVQHGHVEYLFPSLLIMNMGDITEGIGRSKLVKSVINPLVCRGS